jgi:tRNA (guanine-N7-)-methyltransferase
MRKKKWAESELACSYYYVDDPCKAEGKVKSLFKKPQPTHLELGCGKGVFTSIVASSHPDINYVAIDLSTDVLGVARRNIEFEFNKAKRKVDNLLLLRYDASNACNLFTKDDKIERVYINFCNPWPKPKHKKRRITYHDKLISYKEFLLPKAKIYFKTDDKILFTDSIRYFEQSGYDINRLSYDLYSENYSDESIIPTEHEIIFRNQGKNINFLEATLL